MKRYATALFTLLLTLLAVPAIQAQNLGTAVDANAVEEGVISVKLDLGAVATVEAATNDRGAVVAQANGAVQTGLATVDQLNQRFGAVEMERIFRPAGKFEERHRRFGLHQWYTVRFTEDVSARAAVDAYSTAPNISIAEPQYRKTRHVLGQVAPQVQPDEAPNAILNDPEYDTQWHYHNTADNVGTPDADINLLEAHDIESGSSDVIISIVDDGLDLDHPDFEGMLWVNEDEIPGNGIDDDNNGFIDDVHGYDHAEDDGEPEADGYHGTHVAGTVAAKNNNDQYGAGVAGGDGTDGSGVRLMINKTFGTVNAGFAESVVYAADMGAVVSQNSWGWDTPGVYEQAVLDAIDYFNENAGSPDAAMNGGIYVNSSGNSGSGADYYPGFYEGAFAVSSTDENDERPNYSNYGDWVDVAAPGGGDSGSTSSDPCGHDDDDVWSTMPNGFGNACGTSMAAPHVSGVIGLIASANPGIGSEEVKNLLMETGVDVNADQPIGPRIDAYAALQALEEDDIAPAAIDDLAATDVSGNAVVLEWTAPGDDGDTGTANTYALRWSTDGPITTEADFENANPVIGVPAPEPAGTIQSHTVSGLPYSTEVYFAIRATDNVGNTGDLSNSPSATTEPGPAISVDPEAFDVALGVGNSTNETLTISHTGAPGAAPLEWTASIGPAPQAMTLPSDVAAASETASLGATRTEAATATTSYDGIQNEVEQTDATYQLDDGTSENALGLGNQGDVFDMMWLNAFEVVEGAGTVTSISTTWGADGSANAPPAGTTGLALVYNDPNNDGNPSDAVLLSQTEITVTDPGTNNFTTVSTAPTPVEGTFFIAVLLEDNDPDSYPAPMDESSTHQEASWFVGAGTGEDFDIENIGANSIPPTELGSVDFSGNWLLRAEGSAGFLTLEPANGSVAQGTSQNVTATFDAAGIDPGIYEASINIAHNDPSQPTITVPSTMEVTAGPPEIAVDPAELNFGDVFSGTTTTETLTVTNTGGTALEITEATLSGDDAFSLVDPDDAGGYTIPYEGSREIAIQFAPTESGSFNGTFAINTEQGVSASVSLQGEGQPFVSIEPDALDEQIDLTTGDSTATQSFTITNEFDESLPFSVFIEALESEDINFYPQLVDGQLVRWQQMQEADVPQQASDVERTLQAAQKREGGPTTSRLADLLGPVDVTGYANEVIGQNIVSFDLGVPEEFTILDDGVDSYAGNFTFGDNEEIYWIENETNLLKTYNIENGSIEEIGELDPEGTSEEGWTDLETDFTDGTTYVTTADNGSGAWVSRLYKLDAVNAELELVGSYDGLTIAFAIDDEGEGYAHELTNDAIMHVDLETAETELIGDTGIVSNSAQSMTWDGETGQLLMAAYHGCTIFGCTESTLRQVDRETGETTPIGSFEGGANSELGWFATKGQGTHWLATNLEQGVLPAGATLTLEAHFDATRLVEGDYEAQISIVGESLQGQPRESIPVHLSVSAEPVAFLSKDSLTFDPTFVNGTAGPQMVTLRNDGAANMTITDVSIDSDAFQFEGESAFTLEPDQAKVFEVWFAPTEVSDYSAALRFEGEGVSGEVGLAGEGIPAPELTVSPERFDLRAYAGQTYERTLEIANVGSDTLEYALSGEFVNYERPEQSLTFEDVLVEEDFENGSLPEGWTRSSNGDGWLIGDDLGSVFWDIPAHTIYAASNDDACNCDSSEDYLVTLPVDLSDGAYTLTFDSYYTGDFGHLAYVKVSTDGGNTYEVLQELSPADDWTQLSMSLADYAGEEDVRIAFHADDNGSWASGWAIDNVKIARSFPEFITVDPASGSITEGASENVTVGVDAANLSAGTYEINLNVASNDPTQPTATVPVTLEVVENLAVTPEPEIGDDETVYPNETFTVPLVVESLDDLAVRSYQLALSFDADSLEVTGVETDGTLSEDLTLATNIGEGEVQIAAAEGEETQSGAAPVLFDIEGEGTLIELTVRAKEVIGTSTLSFDELMFNEGAPPATSHDASIEIVPLYGDANLNLNVTTSDAIEVLDSAVDIVELNDVETTAADVSGGSSVTAYDAALIFDFLLDRIDCFPAEEGCDEESPALAAKQKSGGNAPSAELRWGEATAASTQQASMETKSDGDGQVMNLPLTVNDASGAVRALQLTTQVDPQMASLDDVAANLPDGWQMAHHIAEDGTVKIAMAGSSPLNGSRNLATLKLRWLQKDAQIEMGGDVVVNEAQPQQMETASVTTIPDQFALNGNYPNPFGQATQIALDLPERANVRIEVYDVLGRRVMVAEDTEMSAGTNRTIQIDGSRLASGMYLYRVTADINGETQVDTGRMTLVR